MKFIRILCILILPLFLFGATTHKKPEPLKPIKLFIEIDGSLYEAIIGKKGVPHGKEVADASTQKRFRDEAKRFGIAYLQDRIILEKKTPDKVGP